MCGKAAETLPSFARLDGRDARPHTSFSRLDGRDARFPTQPFLTLESLSGRIGKYALLCPEGTTALAEDTKLHDFLQELLRRGGSDLLLVHAVASSTRKN